ncbi:citrate/2-methylcitrate synthase [Geodermatophilus sp. Leaf369]|jgi:citrate synthase|nr:citrate/2-methylcitrate synthase [Geodermatophilus sp. Leaf369]QNG35507.1 citrate/2-methylcitrate synthase [Geodermatophilaceae bacterium NBWT11]
MGLFSGLLKGKAAQKAIQMAQKPENQAKVKKFVADRRNKGGGRV